MNFDEAKIKALQYYGYDKLEKDSVRKIDFSTGFRAGVEWAEEFGDCSIIKFFVDANKKAEDSYK